MNSRDLTAQNSTEQQRQINIYGSEIEQHRDKNQRCGNYFMFKRVNHFFKNLTNLCTIIYIVQKKLVDYFIFYKIILKHHLCRDDEDRDDVQE